MLFFDEALHSLHQSVGLTRPGTREAPYALRMARGKIASWTL